MNIAILGTGGVAQTIAPKLAGAGHRVVLGSRDPGTALAWVARSPDTIEVRSYDSQSSGFSLGRADRAPVKGPQ